MIPIITEAEVRAVETAGAYRVMTLREPAISRGTRPGQFVMLDADRVLPRPFSVASADPDEGTVRICFDAIGEGTRRLALLEPGARVRITGPLGIGFQIGEPDGTDLLVGGGYGTAALVGLAQALSERGREVRAILGARTADRLFADPRLDGACLEVLHVTDDGSAGEKGIVTDPVPDLVRAHGVRTVYACGPNPMLAAVGRVGVELGIRSQLAVEEFMACGVGVCWTCVIPIDTPDGRRHQRACTEGPVFDGSVVAWA